MNASEIIGLLGQSINQEGLDFTVRGLALDSRQVGRDYCFFACPGALEDGHDYIDAAVKAGARLVIYEQEHPGVDTGRPGVIFAAVPDVRKIVAVVSSRFFGNPSEKLKITGITGTNGKTTVSFFLDRIFAENGIHSGLIGTIKYRVNDHTLPAKNTTPDALRINHLFRHMIDHGLTHCIMEVSSHALDQHRVEGIAFENVVFTNLTPEHLDYHKNMDDYFRVKAKLFESIDAQKYAIINADSEYGQKLKSLTKANILDYGIDNKQAAIRAEGITLGLKRTVFNLVTPWGRKKVQSGIIGRHNVYNVLAAAAVALRENIPLEEIVRAMKKLDFVPGRLERVGKGTTFQVFVDYAHTDDALQNVLTALRELSPRKIITVFGCGGDRDHSKRPRMGRVAAQLSDYVILTNDNPRGEKPAQIIKEIQGGFSADFKDFRVVLNRKTAIEQALKLARRRDFVLIAGKGHETYQIFDGMTIKFDDRKIVSEILANG